MNNKIIDFKKTVFELSKNDWEVVDILAKVGFTDILKPGMLNTVGRFMTIPKGAAMKKISMQTIEQAFVAKGYQIKNL